MNGILPGHTVPGVERILVIGMGRLGRTIAHSFGDLVTDVVTSRADEVRAAFDEHPFALHDAVDSATLEECDLIWFAVPDRAISDVASEVVGRLDDWTGKVILHSSGATSIAPLALFRSRGAGIGVLHPNAILSGEEVFPQGLVWGITLDGVERDWVERLMTPFAAQLIEVSDAQRSLYHAAATVAANYSMVLFASAVRLYQDVGVERQRAEEIVARFMREGVRVAATEGLNDGLTGPVARGDMATVEAHLSSIAANSPELLDLMTELIRTAVRMVRADEVDEWERMLTRSPQSKSSNAP